MPPQFKTPRRTNLKVEESRNAALPLGALRIACELFTDILVLLRALVYLWRITPISTKPPSLEVATKCLNISAPPLRLPASSVQPFTGLQKQYTLP